MRETTRGRGIGTDDDDVYRPIYICQGWQDPSVQGILRSANLCFLYRPINNSTAITTRYLFKHATK